MITYYEQTKALYEEVNRHLPTHEGNLCGSCNRCCTCGARLGVSELEYDYLEGHLEACGRSPEEADAFREYIQKARDSESGGLLHHECPLYDNETAGCSVYPARPLSCRTFGYFINEKHRDLIPDDCGLKSSVRIYTDETFPVIMPFVIPFYTLADLYEKQKKKQ